MFWTGEGTEAVALLVVNSCSKRRVEREGVSGRVGGIYWTSGLTRRDLREFPS